MGFRSAIHRRPLLVVSLCGAAVLATLVVVWLNLEGIGISAATNGPTPKAWYTVDDGETWFADDADRISPFDRDGKPAYRCSVWTCDGGKTMFVSHVERLKPSLWEQRRRAGRVRPDDLALSPMDVKPPKTGDSGWTDHSSPAGEAIRTPKPPPGQTGAPQPVLPP